VQLVGGDQFAITFERRRVLVGIREDEDGQLERVYWREAALTPTPLNKQLLASPRATLPSSAPQSPIDLKRETLLEDGTRGYFVRAPRTDDCQAAAIATTLQIPIEKVPDPRIDERLAAGEDPESIDRSAVRELRAWLASRGLGMVVHRKLPTNLDRWIGVVPMPGTFNAHCLVMDRENVLFDPARTSDKVQSFGLEHVGFGISFGPHT
jgi:hypothetical protein